MAGPRPGKWSVGLWLAGLAVLVVALHWAWVTAWWVYPGLSEDQRVEQFNDALVAFRSRGVTSRLDRGGMTILGRSDIARVGASRCVRRSECSESVIKTRKGSLGCSYVSVTFDCTYAVTTTDGTAATALVSLSSNRNYSSGMSLPGGPKPLEIWGPGFSEANEKLCELGFGCKLPAGAEAGAPARASARTDAEPSPRAPSATADCKGIRAEVVGRGEICLDPSDPAQRDFRDCNNDFCGPAMVALPKGRSLRGSSAADIARFRKDDPGTEPQSFRNETPQREVTIGHQLAVGKFEVTFAEWDACLADGRCTRRPEDPANRARGARPVVHVSWVEVNNEFLPWLNGKLGLSEAGAYRLLTEAEWEYAARAGTSTKYACGDIISTAQANFYGQGVVEVGSYAPNGFGLHDMHGNVAEWVRDCYANGYDDAPVDGSAHDRGNCGSRVHRGGAWNDVPMLIRSAYRGANDPKDRSGKGFRVARTLAMP
jgi:formylglycine-generating enzyme required for sulfatase activity